MFKSSDLYGISVHWLFSKGFNVQHRLEYFPTETTHWTDVRAQKGPWV